MIIISCLQIAKKVDQKDQMVITGQNSLVMLLKTKSMTGFVLKEFNI